MGFSEERQREILADICRYMGEQLTGKAKTALPRDLTAALDAGPHLAPRVRQTLERILAGDSEKQVALRLGLSRHTVHIYIATIYRRYNVSSRGELVARIFGTSDAPS